MSFDLLLVIYSIIFLQIEKSVKPNALFAPKQMLRESFRTGNRRQQTFCLTKRTGWM